MRRAFVSLIWLFACFTFAVGAPARLPHEPGKPPEQPPVHLDLRGTTWQGNCFNLACWITLEPDGKLTYRTSKNDQNVFPGTWRQTGNQLTFEIAQFSEHRGTITGNTAQGDSSNKSGMRGAFKLQLVPPGE